VSAKTVIHFHEQKYENSWSISFDPFHEPDNKKRGHRGRVEAHSRIDLFSEGAPWSPAEVSWFSIGSVSVEEAEAFSKAVAMAIEAAKKMNAEHGIEATPC
jgi:hypothetical protein